MTAAEIVEQLKPLGQESYRKVLRNHGTPEPFFGVKIEDMKAKFVKPIKKDYQLALDLFDTGIYDAMYLAGLIADETKMTRKDLQHWVENAKAGGIAEYTVPWVASESNHGWDLAREWIESDNESIAASGWATLSSLVAVKDDAELNIPELKRLLHRVQKTIHKRPNRVRYVMNNFVIAIGGYVKPLSEAALQAAAKIGPVECEMVGACKMPDAVEYIGKLKARGNLGKKRKSARC